MVSSLGSGSVDTLVLPRAAPPTKHPNRHSHDLRSPTRAFSAGNHWNRAITPAATAHLEEQLLQGTRDLARLLLEAQLNRLEPDDSSATPARLRHDGTDYRRRAKHPNVLATLFGPVCVRRFLYEALEAGERCLHPLELRLGVVAGCATPALAARAGLAAAEQSQRQALTRLRRDHAVAWSCTTYRKVIRELAAGLAEQRPPTQVEQVLGWLTQAQHSKGRHRPVLAAGRAGIHVPLRDGDYHEGSTATVSVLDRKGKRLGTVYLGRMPEPGQPTLSAQLTDLLKEVLRTWEGPLPRLAYLTDGGWHPSEYYRNVLRTMADPRCPGRRLGWQRVLDFYHACGYVTQFSEALFGATKAGQAWARRMRALLREGQRGSSRVLQAAAWQRNQRPLSASRQELYAKAWGYLHRRRRFMAYADYRRQGLPIGSGVTEAACKTVFTQRLKQSGMRWAAEGGQVILDLRVLVLSGVWAKALGRYFQCRTAEVAALPGTKPGEVEATEKPNAEDTHAANIQETGQEAA